MIHAVARLFTVLALASVWNNFASAGDLSWTGPALSHSTKLVRIYNPLFQEWADDRGWDIGETRLLDKGNFTGRVGPDFSKAERRLLYESMRSPGDFGPGRDRHTDEFLMIVEELSKDADLTPYQVATGPHKGQFIHSRYGGAPKLVTFDFLLNLSMSDGSLDETTRDLAEIEFRDEPLTRKVMHLGYRLNQHGADVFIRRLNGRDFWAIETGETSWKRFEPADTVQVGLVHEDDAKIWTELRANPNRCPDCCRYPGTNCFHTIYAYGGVLGGFAFGNIVGVVLGTGPALQLLLGGAAGYYGGVVATRYRHRETRLSQVSEQLK